MNKTANKFIFLAQKIVYTGYAYCLKSPDNIRVKKQGENDVTLYADVD